MKHRPDVALTMILRNLVAQPSIAQYVFSNINTSYVPLDVPGQLIRKMGAVVLDTGQLTGGDVEVILEECADQSYARPLKMRAMAENRATIDSYLDVVKEWLEMEGLKILVAEAQIKLNTPGVELNEIRSTLAGGMVARSGGRDGLREITSFSSQAIDMITIARQGQRPGRSVGFGTDLDEYWWFEPGGLSIVAGRPGSGKTSLVTSSLVQGASLEHPEAFFSIEMPGYAIAQRIACSLENVSLSELRKGRTSLQETQRVIERLGTLGNSGIFIDDDVVTMEDVYFRSLSLPTPPRVIWIDYGEKVATPENRGRRDLELGYVYTQGKRIAKKLGCHVVILAQLKRDVDWRPDKWPVMSDISESGAAEKDGDSVVLLLRPEYYVVRGQTCRTFCDDDKYGVSYAIVSKNRDGPTGTVRLAYTGRTMTYGEFRGARGSVCEDGGASPVAGPTGVHRGDAGQLPLELGFAVEDDPGDG